MRRSTDGSSRHYVRSNRFLEQSGQWYGTLRGGGLLGPYANRFDAELAICLLTTRLAQIDSPAEEFDVVQRFRRTFAATLPIDDETTPRERPRAIAPPRSRLTRLVDAVGTRLPEHVELAARRAIDALSPRAEARVPARARQRRTPPR